MLTMLKAFTLSTNHPLTTAQLRGAARRGYGIVKPTSSRRRVLPTATFSRPGPPLTFVSKYRPCPTNTSFSVAVKDVYSGVTGRASSMNARLSATQLRQSNDQLAWVRARVSTHPCRSLRPSACSTPSLAFSTSSYGPQATLGSRSRL